MNVSGRWSAMLALVLGLALVPLSARADAIAHWSFDEVSGTAVGDSVRPSSPGTVRNPLTADQNLNTSDSVFGGSSLFLSNGSDYVGVPRLEMSRTSFTIAAWVNPAAIDNGDEIFGDWSSPWQFRLWLNSNGSVSATLRKDGPAAHNGDLLMLGTAGGLVGLDEWTHVAMTWDRGTKTGRLYIDGVQRASSTITAIDLNLKDGNHAEYQIGWKRDDGGGKFYGLMDELWVFDYALSADEINLLQTSNEIPEPASLSLLAMAAAGLGGYVRRRRG